MVGTCTPPPLLIVMKKFLQRNGGNLDVALLSPVEFMKAIIPGMVEEMGKNSNIGTGAAKTF